jgi:hypothetical protein
VALSPAAAIARAPIWLIPTPWPKPEPVNVKIAGAFAANVGRANAGADKEIQTHVYEFGKELGIAFQIHDDDNTKITIIISFIVISLFIISSSENSIKYINS